VDLGLGVDFGLPRDFEFIYAITISLCPNEQRRRTLSDRKSEGKSAIYDVQRALFDVERGFADGFAQGRMRVTRAPDILGTAAKFDY
jgi:hypothetical protein